MFGFVLKLRVMYFFLSVDFSRKKVGFNYHTYLL